MNLVKKNIANKIIVQIDKNIFCQDAEEFEKQLNKLLSKIKSNVILDFGSINYVSARALQTIVQINTVIGQANKILIIMKCPEEIIGVFQSLNVSNEIHFAKTLSEAMIVKN